MANYRDAFPTNPAKFISAIAQGAYSRYNVPGSIVFDEGHGIGFGSSEQVTWLGSEWMGQVENRLNESAEIINEAAAALNDTEKRLEAAEKRIITGGGALDQLDELAERQAARLAEVQADIEKKITSETAAVKAETTTAIDSRLAGALSQLKLEDLQGLAEFRSQVESLIAQQLATAAPVESKGPVESSRLVVDEPLIKRIASALTTQTRDLFVTGEALVNKLDVLGPAVVNDLNVRGALVGRDAILTGTVDVKQLNVTEEMAAQLVRAMNVETKKLVVTEDAILQNANVIGRIVTPLIQAQAVETAELTADKAAIKILESGNITLTGRFQSGPDSGPSLIIPSARKPRAGYNQLALWLSRDGREPAIGEAGVVAGMWLDMKAHLDIAEPLWVRGHRGGGVGIMGNLRLRDQYGGADGNFVYTDRLTVESNGHAMYRSTGGDVTLRAGGNFVNLAAGSIALRNGSHTGSYSKSWGSGGLRPVQIGLSSGTLYTETSSKRVKQDIETTGPDHKWLDIRTVTYREKSAVAIGEAVAEKRAKDPNYQPTPEELDVLHFANTRFTGRLAEEMHEAGFTDQVIYDADGKPDGIDYVRDGVKLIPHVREHRDKIKELEARIAELEELVTRLAESK